jgi:hypothetical protein
MPTREEVRILEAMWKNRCVKLERWERIAECDLNLDELDDLRLEILERRLAFVRANAELGV